MKKYWIVTALMVVMLIMTACGSSDNTETNKEENKNEGTTTEADSKSDYPTKPVTLIVPYSAGGGTDAVGRAIANSVEAHLGQPVGVVNKTGGGGAIGLTEGANSKPDGYTLTMVTAEMTMLPHLGLSPVTYEDFKPVAQFNFDPSSIAVPADAPYDTMEEFIAYAKENPGVIRMGNGGVGGNAHLSASSFEQVAGIELNHVPFDGSAPAVTALLGGHIEALAAQPPEYIQYVESGDFKVLGIMAEERLDVLPDVPTLLELGIDSGLIGTWRGVTVPKDTPEEVIEVLSVAFMKAAEEADFIEFMENNSLGIVIQDADGFLSLMEDSHALYGELIPSLDLQ